MRRRDGEKQTIDKSRINQKQNFRKSEWRGMQGEGNTVEGVKEEEEEEDDKRRGETLKSDHSILLSPK